MFDNNPPMPGNDPESRYKRADETRERRREKADRLHENYDDPPRKEKRWWQFWKR